MLRARGASDATGIFAPLRCLLPDLQHAKFCPWVVHATEQEFDEFDDEDWNGESDPEQTEYWRDDWDTDDVRCSSSAHPHTRAGARA